MSGTKHFNRVQPICLPYIGTICRQLIGIVGNDSHLTKIKMKDWFMAHDKNIPLTGI